MSQRGHTVQSHGDRKGMNLYFFKIQTVEASLDLFQWDLSARAGVFLHVGVCFYMSASLSPCMSEKTDYENL